MRPPGNAPGSPGPRHLAAPGLAAAAAAMASSLRQEAAESLASPSRLRLTSCEVLVVASILHMSCCSRRCCCERSKFTAGVSGQVVPCAALLELVKARFALFKEGRRGFLDVTAQAAQDLVAVLHLHSGFQ